MSKSKNIARLLIDRSGSMSGNWVEVIGGVNAYVEGLPGDTDIQIDAFDAGSPDWYLTLRKGLQKNYEKLSVDTCSPRGMTALNDALGRMLNEVLASKAKKAAIVITTDGQENSSREFTSAQVKELIKKCEDKGYDIVWLGAEFKGVESQAASYGLSLAKTMDTSKGARVQAYRGLADATMSYFSTGEATTFSAETKAKASA